MKNKKILYIQEYELPIAIHKEKAGGFFATCPAWQDVYAQGETLEETISEITKVASSLIEVYKEEQMKVPLKFKKITEEKSKGFQFNFPLIVSA